MCTLNIAGRHRGMSTNQTPIELWIGCDVQVGSVSIANWRWWGKFAIGFMDGRHLPPIKPCHDVLAGQYLGRVAYHYRNMAVDRANASEALLVKDFWSLFTLGYYKTTILSWVSYIM